MIVVKTLTPGEDSEAQKVAGNYVYPYMDIHPSEIENVIGFDTLPYIGLELSQDFCTNTFVEGLDIVYPSCLISNLPSLKNFKNLRRCFGVKFIDLCFHHGLFSSGGHGLDQPISFFLMNPKTY